MRIPKRPKQLNPSIFTNDWIRQKFIYLISNLYKYLREIQIQSNRDHSSRTDSVSNLASINNNLCVLWIVFERSHSSSWKFYEIMCRRLKRRLIQAAMQCSACGVWHLPGVWQDGMIMHVARLHLALGYWELCRPDVLPGVPYSCLGNLKSRRRKLR